MPQPTIVFFCELDTPALTVLVDRPAVVRDLAAMRCGIAIGMLDFSAERADAIRRLTAQGIAVIAWLLLPIEEGYWFNLGNYPQAIARYNEFRSWAIREQLAIEAVGLDFEPPVQEIFSARRRGPRSLFDRALMAQNNALYPAARDAYIDLVAAIRHDGFEVHTYQFPLIVDDRRAGTTLIQRTLDIVDLPADEEVLMIYSSTFLDGYLRGLGGAYLESYGQHADGIAIGVLGGGLVFDPLTGAQAQRMTRREFRRDLRIAASYTDIVYIFSLEGCVDRGWLGDLRTIDWDAPVRVAPHFRLIMGLIRRVIGFALWMSRYGWTALGWLGWLAAGGLLISQRVRNWREQR